MVDEEKVQELNETVDTESTEAPVSEPKTEETISEQSNEISAENVSPETAEGADASADSANMKDLEKKRDANNEEAEKHKARRDELNKETKEWVAKRDELNAQVHALVDEAGAHRKLRDEYNQKVREAKVLRDELNKKVIKIAEEYSALKKDQPARNKDQPSLKQLKLEFSRLETQQQTDATLDKKKEEALVKKIRELNKQISDIEHSEVVSVDLKEKSHALKEAKIEAENAHKLVSEYAEKAQSEHDQMIKLYEQADTLRKEADAAQAKFIECKKQADEEHKKHIEQFKTGQDADKGIRDIKNKQKAIHKKKSDAESKKAADDIFERFKKGEKLSTDDLMALQKSGYL